MLLADGFRMLSHATKAAIAAEQARRLSEPLPGEVETRLADPRVVWRLWETCTPIEQEAARCFLRESVQGFFSKKQWDLLAEKKHAHLTLGLTGLRRIGFVLTVRRLWSDIGFLMPREVRDILLLQLLDEAEAASPAPSEDTLSYYTTGGRGIELDLFAFLQFVREHEVPVTRRQTIHRRVLPKLRPLLSFDERHVGSWFARLFSPALHNAYDAALAVLLDLALRLGLVQTSEQRLVLRDARVSAWLALSPEQRRRQLFVLLTCCYLPHASWLEALALKVLAADKEQWHSLSSLLDTLRRAGFALPPDALEQAREQWLHPLLGFGWVQLGLDREGGLWWRLSPSFAGERDGHGDAVWYVEATGEVIVPPLVPLAALWQLCRLGRLDFQGDMLRCTLLPEKVQAFVLAGGQQQEIESLLASRCPYPLPAGISGMLDSWIKQAKQIRLETWTRVRTADARILEELRQIPLLRPFVKEVVSATDFLVPLSRREALLDALRQCGYLPQDDASIGRAQPVPSDPEAPDTITTGVGEAGLFDPSAPWQLYQVENVYPDRLEGAAQLAELPSMWTRHFQSYHPQTMRDLFRRAKELQLTVRVETTAGNQWEGVPQKIEVEMGCWSITMEMERQKRAKIKLDEIRRVRLVLPDYVESL